MERGVPEGHGSAPSPDGSLLPLRWGRDPTSTLHQAGDQRREAMVVQEVTADGDHPTVSPRILQTDRRTLLSLSVADQLPERSTLPCPSSLTAGVPPCNSSNAPAA